VSPLYDHFTDASSTFEAFLVVLEVLEVLEVLLESPQAARVVTRPAATSGTATHFMRDMGTSEVVGNERPEIIGSRRFVRQDPKLCIKPSPRRCMRTGSSSAIERCDAPGRDGLLHQGMVAHRPHRVVLGE
jgi:hypothetical protein